MRHTLTPKMLTAMHGGSTGEVILPLVTLTHDDWAEPFRIVPNYEAITHVGASFSPLAFDVALPDEKSEGATVLDFVVDNTDQRMIGALRAARGTVAVSIIWVLASSPDDIQVGPMETELSGIEYNAQRITGTLALEPIFDMAFGALVMDPKHAPGLF